MINKRQFKIRDTKKIMHKIGKHWAVVSTLMLGLLAGGTTVANVNHAKAANTTDNNYQANHQLNTNSITSANSTLVHSNNSELTGVSSASQMNSHFNNASSNAFSSASNSLENSNSVHTYNLNSRSVIQRQDSVNGPLNVSSAAEQVHTNVLNGYAKNNEISSDSQDIDLGITKMVNHMLGGNRPTITPETMVNNDLISQLVNIVDNNVQSGANKTNASNAYSNLMSIISPNNLSTVAANSTSASTWYGYLTSFQNDLTTINNNGSANPVVSKILTKLNDLENQPVNEPFIGTVTLKNNASDLLGLVPSYSLNDLATRFDTPGGFAHKILSKVIPNESKLDQIGAVMHVLNNTANNSTLKYAYSNVVNDLTKLPSQNKAQQASTLSDLSNHISTFASEISQNNSYLPSQDKKYFSSIVSGLNSTSYKVGTESTHLNNEVQANDISSINNELNQYNVGSLFNDVINYATHNNDYAKLDSVANDAKTDFANATDASAFINSFVGQIADLKNANASTIYNDLNNIKSNSAVNDAYNLAKANSSAANNVLNNLAGLNSANATDNLDNVHNIISGNASLSSINALSNVAASASTEATSVSNDNAYNDLLNNESTLFSGVVNRINASGFNSNAFNTLVSNAKNDLAHATNVSDFANDLNGQAGAFDGVTAQKIKGYLTNLKSNPELSNAYQTVRTNSFAADSILNDLSGMTSNNEVAKLSDIANVAKTDFSNSASFGSLATDASNMQASVANSQSTAASQAYSSLLNNHEASLFSAVVNRIVARGFGSAAFKTLVNNAKTDLSSAANASDFVTSLEAQDGNFDGVTANELKTLLNRFADNPEFNKAYQAVRVDSASADGMLNDLAEMSAGNEVNELDKIQQIASHNFSNSASFGSLAADAAHMANSVAANQPAHKEVTTSSAINSLVSGFPTSAALSYVASKFASSGFDKAALFDTLFNNAKNAFDNHNDTNAGTFLNDFSSQAKADFPANDDEFINAAVSDMASNPNISEAYTFLRNNSTATNNVLSNLATMDPENASAAFNSVANVINDTPAFKNVPKISTVANSAVSAANSASASVSESTVASVVKSARNDATAASNAVTDFEKHNRNLPSNSDGYLASSEVLSNAASDAAKAGSYATDASNDAVAETGVHVAKGQLDAGLPQYADDVTNARKYRNNVRVDLENAQQDANLSREFANIDKEFNTLGVEPIFRILLNNAVNHNDYNKLSTAAAKALQAFNNSTTLNNFLKEFTGIGKTFNTLRNNASDPDIQNAYQIAKHNPQNTENILNDLKALNSTNVVSRLRSFHDDLTTNSVASPLYKFNQLQILDNVASDAINESNQIISHKSNPTHEDAPHYASQAFNNNINQLIIKNGWVKSSADSLANDTNLSERKLFSNIFGDLQKLPNSNVNNVTIKDIINKLGRFPSGLSSVAKGLFKKVEAHDASPSALATYADQIGNETGGLINDFNKTMQDVKNDPNNKDYQRVLSDLNELNAKNEDSKLKDVAATINAHGLKNNPLLKALALEVRHVANAESSERKKDNAKRRSDEAAQKEALQNRHNTDSRRHDALTKDLQHHKKDVARHDRIVKDRQQQKQDSIRHNKLVAARHQHNLHDVSRAESYAKNASAEAQAAQKSAASAQQYAHGLNSSGNAAFGSSAGASTMVLYADSYEREAESDATQALDDVKAINADYDNVSLADADVANASSAASDASDAVSYMSKAITLASKCAKADGYVAPSSSTSNGSGKSSGSSSSSSSTASGKASGKSGTSSTSSNRTKPSSQSSVTPTSNGKKTSGSTSQSTNSSSKSDHGSKGSSSSNASHQTSSGSTNSNTSSSANNSKTSSGASNQASGTNSNSGSSTNSEASNSTSGASSNNSSQASSTSASNGKSSASSGSVKSSSNRVPSSSLPSSTTSNRSSSVSTSSAMNSAKSAHDSSVASEINSIVNSARTSQSASVSASEASSQAASAAAASDQASNFTPNNNASNNFDWNQSSNTSFSFGPTNSMESSSSDQSHFVSESSASSNVDNASAAPVTVVNVKNPLKLGVDQAMISDKALITRVRPHYRWFEVSKTCLAHYHIGSVGKAKDYGKVLRAGYLARIEKVFKVSKNGHVVYRYEINVDGHNYYVTGNSKFTHESYYQTHDLADHHIYHSDGERYYEATVKVPCLIYNSPLYSPHHMVRKLYRNDKVRIKRLIKIGRKGDYMTRFELIDGTFVTANKYFLKLI